MFVNGQQNVKIVNVFLHMNFPLYSICIILWSSNIVHQGHGSNFSLSIQYRKVQPYDSPSVANLLTIIQTACKQPSCRMTESNLEIPQKCHCSLILPHSAHLDPTLWTQFSAVGTVLLLAADILSRSWHSTKLTTFTPWQVVWLLWWSICW